MIGGADAQLPGPAGWNKAHRLTLDLYRLTKDFPRDEQYGLTSQLRRSAISIGSNLAGGCGRKTSTELARFVRIAMGSASKLDYQILVSRDLGFMKDEDFSASISSLTEVRKMLSSFLNSVEAQVDRKQ